MMQQTRPAAEGSLARPVRVLLVEDNDDHSQLAQWALARAGPLSIDRVASGADALAHTADQAYDAIVLDYLLGDMDGVGVLRQLRAAGTATPVLLLTSHGSEDVAAGALRARADDYLPKDLGFVGDCLGRAVLAMIERRRLTDALLRAREEFVTAASHDLKSPLTVIKGTIQLLRLRLVEAGMAGVTTDDVRQREYESSTPVTSEEILAKLARIEQSVGKALTQLEQLVEAARLQMGGPVELHEARLDLVPLVRESAATHQQTTDRHQIRVEASQSELVGWWDGARLERVLSNLLGNAVKYSPTGGEIRIDLARETQDGTDWAVIRVSDQGVGIPAQDLPHVAEPFYRASNARELAIGSGIGLAGVRQIVEQHGGTLSVESQVGHGTTCTVRLPLVSQAELVRTSTW
jgi:signal transduction histidine kinase